MSQSDEKTSLVNVTQSAVLSRTIYSVPLCMHVEVSANMLNTYCNSWLFTLSMNVLFNFTISH